MKLPRLPAWARAAISAALLVGLVYWVGPAQLLESLRDLRWEWLAAAVAVNYLALALGAVNVAILTRAVVPHVSRRAAAGAFLRSWAVGMVAPGKFGDLSYSHFLSDDETNLAPGLAVGIVDKVITFAVTAAIALAGLAAFVGFEDAAYGAAFAGAALAVGLVALFSPRLRGVVRTRLLGRHATRFSGFSAHVNTLLVKRRGILALNVFLTVVRMIVMGVTILFGFRALQVEAPLLDVVVIQAVTQLVSLIPVTLAGLGVRQGTSVVLFERISGIAAAPVLNQSLIMALLSYANVALVFALLGAGRRER